MPDEPADLNGEEENESGDVDWKDRTLCSDESCIGVIGPDGRCKECGQPHEPSQAEADYADQSDSPPVDEPAVEPPPTSDSDDDWENRTLCSDESCIGVIGPDGRCKECGKPYAG